jgi:hypothetical protein
METNTIAKIALGKKPLNFIDYEVVIETRDSKKVLIAINLTCKGSLLTKIKTCQLIQETDKRNLFEISEALIKDFLTHGACTLNDAKNVSSKPVKSSGRKCSTQAKQHTAESLFQNYNL